MPSRWEQFNAVVEKPMRNPTRILSDDASLTLAGFLCSVGDPGTPDGWANVCNRLMRIQSLSSMFMRSQRSIPDDEKTRFIGGPRG